MYANAFIQTPADMTPRREMETKEFLLQRAKNLYLRGRGIHLVSGESRPAILSLLENASLSCYNEPNH